jgi:hypothetical protein
MTDLYNEVLQSETMPLTAEQLEQLKRNYASMIVNDMDMKTLMIMAYDVIVENLKDYDEEDIKQEIFDSYGIDEQYDLEKILEELMP